MTAPICITKDEMERGLAAGRTLIQEEWAHPQEIKWADELVGEGKAKATEWDYRDNFQGLMRRITAAERR